MCACRPNVRTPNCGSMACLRAARSDERVRISSWLRREADYARRTGPHLPVDRAETADAIARWIETGEWEQRTEARTGHLASEGGS